MIHSGKSGLFFKWLLGLFVLVCLLLVWATAFYVLDRRQASDLRNAEVRTQGQAQVYAEFSRSTIKRINEVMLSLRSQWQGDWRSFAERVQMHQESIQDISFQIAVIDKDGLLAFSNLAKPSNRTNLSQREHFIVHQQSIGVDRLFISKPVKGSVSGKWSIQFTRPIFEDKKFRGVLVLSVSPELFSKFTEKLHLQGSNIFQVVRSSGHILATYPWDESVLGSQSRDLDHFLPDAVSTGNFQDSNTADGQEHVYGFSRLEEYGLTFVAGTSKADILGNYAIYRRSVLWVAVCLSVLLAVFLWLGYSSIFFLMKVQRDLLVAKEHAEVANVSKSMFLSNMSHELRTPMNAILGMLNLLQRTSLTPQQLDYSSKTELAAKSLLGLLNDILDISKVELGKLTPDPQPFRVDRLVTELSSVLCTNVGGNEIEVLFDIDPRLPQVVMGDILRLKQILLNLGGNAIKFTSKGKVVLRFRLEMQETHRVVIEFSVSDTGIGIAPEHQKRIFSVFSQAEESTTRRFGGSGLGLLISRSLVEIMGGDLKFQSELGVGSRFYFSLTFPIVLDIPPELAQPLPLPEKLPPANLVPVDDVGNSRCRLAGMRILVVEDNLFNQQVAKELLTIEGALVSLADNGQLGVEAVAAADPQFDVVLMDLQMPVLDGFEATRAIRQQLGLTKLPVIALSANALASDRENSLAAGMNDHVGKPFDIAKLAQLLIHYTGWSAPTHETTPLAPDRPEKYSKIIDVEGALVLMGGNLKLYRHFLDPFMVDVSGIADPLQAHLLHGEYKDAARVLHTLKGLTATAGATDLSAFAAQAEKQLKQEPLAVDGTALVAQVRTAVDAVLMELKDVIKKIDANTA